MKLRRYKFVIISLIILGFMAPPSTGQAATASLYLTPASATQATGSNFTIYVGVNSNGNAINAVEATVTIPSLLAISGAGTGGSICSIWVQQPAISGQTVSFKCGIPGGTTASGNLISISLHANTIGSGGANISAARVLAGPGQDVTGGTSGGNYTVTAAPANNTNTAPKSGGTTSQPTTAAPTISSGTHPDQNKWYTNASPSFAWAQASGITGFSYTFDQNSDTTPSTTANLVYATSANFPDQPDGTWYFHIRANSANGWSATNSYRVQIDKTAPTGLTIVTEPKVIADKRPMVSFTAVDATSGIDHYEISLDKDAFKTVTSPYTPESITSGEHVFRVRAFDKAGNMVEGSSKITIKNIPIPKIISPTNNTTLKLIEKLDISGTAEATTAVDLYIDGKLVAHNVTVSSEGTWSYTYRTILLPGKHEITAKAVKDGIESLTSGKITIQIDPSAVSLLGTMLPLYVVIIGLLVIIAILVFILVWLFIVSKRRYHTIKERFVRKAEETERSVVSSLDGMQSDIHKDIDVIYDAKIRTPKEKRALENQIEGEIASTKKVIDSEIKNETKDL